MIIVSGDIVNAKEQIIIHQVNCQNKMGSGVAKALYEKYPEVKTQYHSFCDDWEKQGGAKETLLGQVCVVDTRDGKTVINCYSQLDYGYDGKQYTDYDAIRECFSRIVSLLRINDLTDVNIAIPYMYGCGLGGGDWEKVSRIIEYFFGDHAVIYKLED